MKQTYSTAVVMAAAALMTISPLNAAILKKSTGPGIGVAEAGNGLRAWVSVGYPAGVKAATPKVTPHLHTMFILYNTTSSPVKYSQGGLGVHWEIINSAGKVMYDSNVGKMIPQFLMVKTLTPRGHSTMTDEVPLQTQEGAPLSPGHYSLHAQLMGTPKMEAWSSFTVFPARVDRPKHHGLQ